MHMELPELADGGKLGAAPGPTNGVRRRSFAGELDKWKCSITVCHRQVVRGRRMLLTVTAKDHRFPPRL